ncbi:MAG TPA: YheU family protein [Steroidobacteraceae bacterium]|nr:YheU family protein [Steroidobacteraceae bacterium]
MNGVADDDPPELVDIPLNELAPDTLRALVESFVLREGTDYGVQEVPLATKVGQVVGQLQRGEARIVFDPATESVDIRVTKGK